MKFNYLVLLSSLVITTFGCEPTLPDPDKNKVENNQEIFNAYNFSELDITGPTNNLNVVLREGDKLVFKYYSTSTEPRTASLLMFEVDRLAENFSINNFSDGRTVYATLDRDGNLIYNFVNKGTISGRKLNSAEWEVAFSVSGNDELPLDLTFSNVFKVR